MFQFFPSTNKASGISPSRTIDLQENVQKISNLCADPKSDRLVVGFNDGLIIVVNENGKTTKLNCERQNNSYREPITALTFIDADLIAAAHNKQIYIFNIQTSQCITKLIGHTEDIWSLAVSNKGDLFSASTDKTIRIWDIKQSTCKSIIKSFHGQAYHAAIDFLANICRYSQRLTNTLNYLTGYMLLANRDDWVSCILPLSNSNVICGTKDAVIALLDENGCCTMEVKAGEWDRYTAIDWYGNSHQHITGFVEHNNFVISSSRDGTVQVWDKTTLQLKQKLHTSNSDYQKKNQIQSIAVIDNYIIAFSSTTQNLYIWDMSTWKCTKTISGLSEETQLAVTMNNEILLAYKSMDEKKATNNIYIIPLHTCLSTSEDEVTLNSLLKQSDDVRNVCKP